MHPLQFMISLKRWVASSIHRRLIAWSTLFWLGSVAILGVTFLQVGQAQILNETRQRNVQLASVVSRDVNAKIASVFSDIREFSRRLEQLNSPSDSEAAQMALRFYSPQRARAVYYFKNNGDLAFHFDGTSETTLTSNNPATAVSRSSIQPDSNVMSAYQGASSAGTYLSDITFTGIDRTPVCYVGMRITPSWETAAVVVVQVDLRDIWQRVELSTIGQSGFAYAVSRQGIIIAHPDPAYLGRHIAAEVGAVVAGFEGSNQYTDPSTRDRVVAAYSPVGGSTGWGIVVQQREAEVNASVVSTGIYVIVILLALAIVGNIGILLLVKNVTRPIEELTETTQSIARTGYLTKTTLAYKPDEIGQLSQAFDEMIERLQTTEGRLATVAADERNRLARDLHDAVTQTLFSASLISEVLPALWERNEDEGRKRLEEVRQLTRGALAEMRTLLLELRPSAIVEAELGQLLRQLAESINGRSRIPVTVEVDGQYGLPNDVKVALYRIAQEALNNIAKHAGASEARVSLRSRLGMVTLRVADNGHGFDVASIKAESLGLGIMRERAGDIGASLTVHSRVGEGTDIAVFWTNGSGEAARLGYDDASS